MAHVAKAMPAAHLLVQACQHVWLVLDDGACANVHICWSYPSIPSASPHSCSQVRPCLTARLTGYPGGYIVPRASHRAVASSACPGRERLMEQPVSSSHFFLLKQRFMRLLVARCASSRRRRLDLPAFIADANPIPLPSAEAMSAGRGFTYRRVRTFTCLRLYGSTPCRFGGTTASHRNDFAAFRLSGSAQIRIYA